jgi:hypothetical protein
MQVSEVNHNDFVQGREAEADAQLLVKFFLKEKEDKTATAEEGRPIFKELEYIEIRAAGKRDAMACRPATHHDKQRFPRHYDAFKRRVEMPVEGTPLSEWPLITRSTAEELSFLKVKTVEQLISMSDSDAGNFRGGLALKQKAAEFLKYSDKTKLIEEKQDLQDQLATQSDQIAELKKMVEALQSPPLVSMPPKLTTPPPEITEDAPAPSEVTEDATVKPKHRRRQQVKKEG